MVMRLHETVTLPAFLYNAETWDLNCGERKEVEKAEIWAWKHMLGLPTTTPNPAVVFATGSLYATIRIDQKRLLYLHQLLQKDPQHYAVKVLKIIDENNCGWAKSIRETLSSWKLEQKWNKIAKKSKTEWRAEVEKAAEDMNVRRLQEECRKRGGSGSELKTKTKSIVEELEKSGYKRKALEIMHHGSITASRAIIMGRYGMLQCKANFSLGKRDKDCGSCGTLDDEDHIINHCVLYRNVNLFDSIDKLDFNIIYSDKIDDSLRAVDNILKVWDLGNGRNVTRT